MLGTHACTVGYIDSDQWFAHKGFWLAAWFRCQELVRVWSAHFLFSMSCYYDKRVLIDKLYYLKVSDVLTNSTKFYSNYLVKYILSLRWSRIQKKPPATFTSKYNLPYNIIIVDFQPNRLKNEISVIAIKQCICTYIIKSRKTYLTG